LDIKIRKAKSLKGEIEVPGDKSISHRAAIFALLAPGKNSIKNFLFSADCEATLTALSLLGGKVSVLKDKKEVMIEGGEEKVKEPADIIDCGNSGTTMRIISGLVASFPFLTILTGDSSLKRRPMQRIIDPLSKMGALILSRNNGFAPLVIKGKGLQGIDYDLPVASAQVKSAIILAGIRANGRTIIKGKIKSRDHTERILSYLGAKLKVEEDYISVERSVLFPFSLEVPGDISSAAYFLVAALLLPNSEITIRNVGFNPTRIGIINVLKRMGAQIDVYNMRESCGEPIVDLYAKTSSLKAVSISQEEIPFLIDEIPLLSVAMSLASGESEVSGAQELRVKETDRIKAICDSLSRLGVNIKEKEDGFKIKGPSRLKGNFLESYGDHRMAMAMAIAAILAEGESVIREAECVSVSFPDFWNLLKKVVSF
jgi:3-phosphoshikimate 1-carboxyvinyltransferase